MSASRLAGLDGLRGVAALCILVFHATPGLLGSFRGNAYLAVDLFFMLSGYVIARTYEARLGDGLSPAAFLTIRYRRLWPTMFIGGLMGLPWFFITFDSSHWWIAIANLLLIPTFLFNRVYVLNAPAWSIFFELVANMLHAVILRRVSTGCLIIAAIAAASFLAFVGSRSTLDIGSQPSLAIFAIFRVMLSYMIGVILWRRWKDKPPYNVPPALAFAAMPLLLGAGTLLGHDYWLTGMIYIILVCPLMIAGGLRLSGVQPFARLIGDMSFPLYAFHANIFLSVELAGLNVPWGIALSLAAAYLFTRLERKAAGRPLPASIAAPI